MFPSLTIAALAGLVLSPLAAWAQPSATPWKHGTLDPAQRQALVAFARVYGYVRYFHPSDESAALDWDAFAIYGARRMLDEPDRPLADRLRALLEPIAPTMRFGPEGERTGDASPSSGTYVAWQHLGVAGSENLAAGRRSQRVRFVPGEPFDSATQVFARLPDPEREILYPFAPGAALRLPLALPLVDGVPRGSAPDSPRYRALLDSLARITRGTARLDAVEVRLADVIVTWNVLQHFHPYLRETGVRLEADLPSALAAAAESRDAGAHVATLRGMVQRLEDGHATVAHPTLRRTRRNGWLPIFVWPLGDTVIVTASRDPVIRAGDELVDVDGVRATVQIATTEDALLGTPRRRREAARGTAFRGERDSPATVRVRRNGADIVLRTRFVADSLGGPRLTREFSPGAVVELEPGTWYVDMLELTEERLAASLQDLVRARALILDFRHYTQMVPSLLAHLATTSVRSIPFRTREVIEPDHGAANGFTPPDGFTIPPRAPHIGAAIIALSSGGAMSRAETYLSILKHNRLAVIVGEASAGANGGLDWFTTPGGVYVSLTGDHVRNPDGSAHYRVGVLPDTVVTRTAAGVRAGRDEVLDAARRIARRIARP